MALSYSFRTEITSGYIRGTRTGGLAGVLESLVACAKPACHPLLLPVLMLGASLYPETETQQWEVCDRPRGLESAMRGGGRYKGPTTQGYDPEIDIKLERGNHKVAELQWKVMWKQPHVWQVLLGVLIRQPNTSGQSFRLRIGRCPASNTSTPQSRHASTLLQ